MAERFLDKYRIETTRARWWDYSGNGVYFITINTYNQERFFSSIKEGTVLLSDCGKVVKSVWESLPEHFSYISIDEFVIMPDHFHGIISITNTMESDTNSELYVNENHAKYDSEQMSMISPKTGSLPRVIGNFKSVVSRRARKIVHTFKWQERYYDRIIQDTSALAAVREYIRMNPIKWNKAQK